jgi:glycine/D-amino acid oxidase-like deaminating enzyme
MSQSPELFDVVIVGAGLSGLATALSIVKAAPNLKVAVIGPKAHFASNQPGIATHPNYSLDHNFLSQWTAFTLPLTDAALTAACAIDPSVCLARGRWHVARTSDDADRIKTLNLVFNQHVPEQFHGQWMPKKSSFGALWLPSAWAISPPHLRQVWEAELIKRQCQIINRTVTQVHTSPNTHLGLALVLEPTSTRCDTAPTSTLSCRAKSVVFCNPSGVHSLLGFRDSEVSALPLTQWPGQSKLETLSDLYSLYGNTTVQTDHFAIPLNTTTWLVRNQVIENIATSSENTFLGDRWHAPDRMPYLGRMFDIEAINTDPQRFLKYEKLAVPELAHVYLNVAHGSRGLMGSIGGAQQVTQMLLGTNTSLPQHLQLALHPSRYVRRHLRDHLQSAH